MELTPLTLVFLGLCLRPGVVQASGPRLSVRPDRSRFLRLEQVTFSCSMKGWTVKRNASSGSGLPCVRGWGVVNGTSCRIPGLYTSDSGSYWCESDTNERSNVLHVTVCSEPVILESPVLPVVQGSSVSLQCLYKKRYDKVPTTDFEASFYKDGVFIGKHSQGRMRLSAVSRDQQGLYKCQHPTTGESSEVLLRVRETPDPMTLTPTLTPDPPGFRITLPRLLCFVLLFILYTIILFLAIKLYIKWAQARADAKRRGADRLM